MDAQGRRRRKRRQIKREKKRKEEEEIGCEWKAQEVGDGFRTEFCSWTFILVLFTRLQAKMTDGLGGLLLCVFRALGCQGTSGKLLLNTCPTATNAM